MEKKIIVLLITAVFVAGAGWALFGSPPERTPSEEEEGVAEKEEDFQEIKEILPDILAEVKKVRSLSYNFTETEEGKVVSGKIYQKEDKIRMEVEEGGEQVVTLLNIDEKSAYTYFPSENIALEIEFDEASDALDRSVKEQALAVFDHDLEVTGKEEVGGKETVVIEYTAERENVKMWIWKEYGLPVKVETGLRERKIEIREVDFNYISDDMFNLPPDVQLVESPFI